MDTKKLLMFSGLGGVAGTAVMTMMMYFVAPKMVGETTDIAEMLGEMMGGGWAMGMAMHWMNGVIVFPLILVFAIHRFIPGSIILKSIGWGVALWLIAQVVIMPMAGMGMFSSEGGGMKAVMASLVGHIVYGALLGVISNLARK